MPLVEKHHSHVCVEKTNLLSGNCGWPSACAFGVKRLPLSTARKTGAFGLNDEILGLGFMLALRTERAHSKKNCLNRTEFFTSLSRAGSSFGVCLSRW